MHERNSNLKPVTFASSVGFALIWLSCLSVVVRSDTQTMDFFSFECSHNFPVFSYFLNKLLVDFS